MIIIMITVLILMYHYFFYHSSSGSYWVSEVHEVGEEYPKEIWTGLFMCDCDGRGR